MSDFSFSPMFDIYFSIYLLQPTKTVCEADNFVPQIVFFCLSTLFMSKFYSCLHIKFGKYQEGTHTSLNRICSSVQHIRHTCMFFSCASETNCLFLWIISLNALVLGHLRSLCWAIQSCSGFLTAPPPYTGQQPDDYRIHSDGKNYRH